MLWLLNTKSNTTDRKKMNPRSARSIYYLTMSKSSKKSVIDVQEKMKSRLKLYNFYQFHFLKKANFVWFFCFRKFIFHFEKPKLKSDFPNQPIQLMDVQGYQNISQKNPTKRHLSLIKVQLLPILMEKHYCFFFFGITNCVFKIQIKNALLEKNNNHRCTRKGQNNNCQCSIKINVE